MAITNYSELQTAVSDWSHRSVDQVVDFITLAERRINSKLNDRVAEVETPLTAVIDSRYIPLPEKYILPLALWRDYPAGIKTAMVYVTPEILGNATDSAGFPEYYTIDGENIAFDSSNSQAFEYVLRYKKQYNLAVTSTNYVLTNYPDCYLFASLVEAAMFARDFDMYDRWEARYQEALTNAITSESSNKALSTLFFDPAMTDGQPNNIYTGGF